MNSQYTHTHISINQTITRVNTCALSIHLKPIYLLNPNRVKHAQYAWQQLKYISMHPLLKSVHKMYTGIYPSVTAIIVNLLYSQNGPPSTLSYYISLNTDAFVLNGFIYIVCIYFNKRILHRVRSCDLL